MKFSDWFNMVESGDGTLKRDRFFELLEKLNEAPQYTETVAEWLKAAFEAGQASATDVAQHCANLCEEQSKFLERFSQYGSNAAADCAKLIKDTYLRGK